MEWDLKVQMVKLGNQMNGSDNTIGEQKEKEFQNLVLLHINDFDSQAWDMFMNIVEIIPEKMEPHKEFWQKVFNQISKIESLENIGTRAAIRMEFLLLTCMNDLGFSAEELTTS